MHIAYIISSTSNRGPINVVYNLVNELKKEHDVDIYCFKDKKELDFDVPIKKIGFLESIDFDKYDIIHSHGVVPDAYVWFHRKKIIKASTLTTLHNIAHEDFSYQYNPVKAKLMLSLWNRATSSHDKVVVLSQYAKKEYLKYWKNKNIEVVHNGIPKKYQLKEINDDKLDRLKNNYILLGVVGILTKVKGFEQVIKSLVYLPKHALVIVGDGVEMQALKELAMMLNVEDRVYFTGFQKNIDSYIHAIDIVVIPSRSEGFSLVAIEAMRMKKPIVTSNLEIFEELFDVNRFALDDIEQLANSIKGVKLGDDDHNYREFLAKFTSEIMAKKYEKLYMDLRGNDAK